MRKIFLEELPRDKRGRISWKKSIEYKVKFIYDDIEDKIEIIDYYKNNYNKPYLTVKYKDKVKPIFIGNFKNCQLGNILDKVTNDFKVEIGTRFKDNKRDITIVDREIREVKKKDKKCKKGYAIAKQKWYKYHCNIDGNEDWIVEGNLLRGKGCNVCSGDKVTEYNCMWNTDRELCISLGVPEEVARKVTRGSGVSISFNCKCGNEVTIKPYNIIKNKSIGCKKCSDGISYPNKFMYEFCNQLLEQGKIKHFETEYEIENKKYDMFVMLNSGETLIIENHGEQHGEFIYRGDLLLVKETKGFSKRDEIKNDIYKCKLAYKNGIDNYIQSDCTISDLEYIKHSIKNSWLSKIFDLSNIDWNKCNEYALKNMVYEVCEYWHEHREVNKEDITTNDLGKIFGLSRDSIVNYLHKGNELGRCNYTGNKKKVLVYNLNMNYIGEYESASWLERNSIELFGFKLLQGNISDVCKGKRSSYKGFIFKYAKTIDK